MSSPLWERLLVAAVGPIVTAALALFVLNAVASSAQRRRDASDARESLATELTETANSLYLALQAFWRAARDIPLAERKGHPGLAAQREQLDSVYQAARAQGQVIEQRLRIYFASPAPSASWHKVTDLLTVRYFLLLESDPARRARIRSLNAGEGHSGLTEDELDRPSLLLESYRQALAETVASLWNHELDRRGRHLKGATTVTTWHARSP